MIVSVPKAVEPPKTNDVLSKKRPLDTTYEVTAEDKAYWCTKTNIESRQYVAVSNHAVQFNSSASTEFYNQKLPEEIKIKGSGSAGNIGLYSSSRSNDYWPHSSENSVAMGSQRSVQYPIVS